MATTQATRTNPVWARAIPANAALPALAPPSSAAGQALTFLFNTSHQLRVVTRDGEPWFVASDLAKALGYRDAANMTRVIDAEDLHTHNVSTSAGSREATIVNESGLYCAIFASRRPEAKQFKRWVTTEVLPAIRRTGSYAVHARAAEIGFFQPALTAKLQPPAHSPRAINKIEYGRLADIVDQIAKCYRLEGMGRFAAWRVAREAAGASTVREMSSDKIITVVARLREFLASSKELHTAVEQLESAHARGFKGIPDAKPAEVVWTSERVEEWLKADRASR